MAPGPLQDAQDDAAADPGAKPGERRQRHTAVIGGARATDPVDRRDETRQRPIAGGSRATDPPLTTRDIADWMGLTTEWVRGAIDEGLVVGGVLVRLDAETLTVNGRRLHRVHLDRFRAFLKAIGWRRIPSAPR
jgi:hypothetical protein